MCSRGMYLTIAVTECCLASRRGQLCITHSVVHAHAACLWRALPTASACRAEGDGLDFMAQQLETGGVQEPAQEAPAGGMEARLAFLEEQIAALRQDPAGQTSQPVCIKAANVKTCTSSCLRWPSSSARRHPVECICVCGQEPCLTFTNLRVSSTALSLAQSFMAPDEPCPSCGQRSCQLHQLLQKLAVM